MWKKSAKCREKKIPLEGEKAIAVDVKDVVDDRKKIRNWRRKEKQKITCEIKEACG